MHDPQSLHDTGWKDSTDRAKLYKDPTTPAREAKLKAALTSLPQGARVLDYGCGRAEFTDYLASLGFGAVGIDLSPEAIRLNQADFPAMEFLTVAADKPAPFPDGSFDAIWCSEVIEHVYDVHGIFAEFDRLLKVGGKLAITTPYHGWLKNMLVMTFGFEKHFDVEWQHIRFWTKRSMTKVAAAHHLRPLVWDSVGRVPWIAKSFFVTFEKVGG